MGLQGQNFTKWKGDDFTIVFTINDATNLTGYTAVWNMSVSIDSAKLITKSSGGGGITFDGNKVLVTIASAITKEDALSIPAGNYYHELQLTDSSNMKTVAATGIVELKTPSLKRP